MRFVKLVGSGILMVQLSSIIYTGLTLLLGELKIV